MQYRQIDSQSFNHFWDRSLTQSGDRLCVPEAVGMSLGLLQGLGQTWAQGEEVEGSLDLLLLLFRKRVQLGQGKDRLWAEI